MNQSQSLILSKEYLNTNICEFDFTCKAESLFFFCIRISLWSISETRVNVALDWIPKFIRKVGMPGALQLKMSFLYSKMALVLLRCESLLMLINLKFFGSSSSSLLANRPWKFKSFRLEWDCHSGIKWKMKNSFGKERMEKASFISQFNTHGWSSLTN